MLASAKLSTILRTLTNPEEVLQRFPHNFFEDAEATGSFEAKIFELVSSYESLRKEWAEETDFQIC